MRRVPIDPPGDMSALSPSLKTWEDVNINMKKATITPTKIIPITNPYSKKKPRTTVKTAAAPTMIPTTPTTPTRPSMNISGDVASSLSPSSTFSVGGTSFTCTPCNKSLVASITPEQRKVMEINRKRALERRATKLQQEILSRSPTRKKKAKITTTTTTRILSSSSSSSATTKASKPSTAASYSRNPPCCSRCGSTDQNSLCIIWNHQGEKQRTVGRYDGSGDASIRYTCCGRYAPSPCFVGRHEYIHDNSLSRFRIPGGMTIECDCHNNDGPARLMMTIQKGGPNLGRYYFSCSSYGHQKECCKFFQWADTAYNLCPQRRETSPDGINEWIDIYANPFQEDYDWLTLSSSSTSFPVLLKEMQSVLRQRFVGALLLHESCKSVTTSSEEGIVRSVQQLEVMCESIQDCFGVGCGVFDYGDDDDYDNLIQQQKKQLGDNILNHLYPLTKSQISRRFGLLLWDNDDDNNSHDRKEPATKNDTTSFTPTLKILSSKPTKKECYNAIQKAIETNHVLKSCGVKLETITRGGNVLVTFCHLEGLENYLAVSYITHTL